MSEPSHRPDDMAFGFGLGCACQIVLTILGLVISVWAQGGVVVVIANVAPAKLMLSEIAMVSWGVTQWIALIPLILHQRKIAHPETVRGLLAAGILGVLLSSACAALTMY